MPDIVEAWLWRDPAQIIERLVERSAREVARKQNPELWKMECARPARDRYYTLSRRIRIKHLAKETKEGK